MSLQTGFVHIYTGNGKGKTTAAIGLAVRALGAGLTVCLIQFMKKKPVSEMRFLKQVPGVRIYRFGSRGWVGKKPRDLDRVESQKGLVTLRRVLESKQYDCVIADEICVALSLGLLKEAEVLACLAKRPQGVELVLTGRGASATLQRAADLVTEMKEKKHYYRRGVPARRGIEF